MSEKQLASLLAHSRESNLIVKSCLKSALIHLSSEMDFDQISITKLCNRAGVSRMAFYRNYQTIQDVVAEIIQDMNQQIIDRIGSPFQMGMDRNWYVLVFEKIKQQKKEWSLLFIDSFQKEWIKSMYHFSQQDHDEGDDKKYLKIIWSGGFENIVTSWLKNGMKESCEQMADYCCRYLPSVLVQN